MVTRNLVYQREGSDPCKCPRILTFVVRIETPSVSAGICQGEDRAKLFPVVPLLLLPANAKASFGRYQSRGLLQLHRTPSVFL